MDSHEFPSDKGRCCCCTQNYILFFIQQ